MKAAIWTEPNKMEIRDIPIPQATPKEVLIKVHGCGVCGTDVHIFSGEVPLAKPPQVLGHEVYGKVVEVGSEVTKFKAGDSVSVDPVVGCGTCSYCQEGKTNLCSKPTIIGYARCGGFAQYTTVPATHLYKTSDDKMDSKAGIIAETLACVLNGYDRLNIRCGSSVMILGAGSVGLLWNQLVKKTVVTKIFQTEVIAARRETAKRIGADIVIDSSKPDWQKEVKELEPEGIDYIIDATGTSQAIQESFGLLRRGGSFMIFGVCPEEERITISPFEMFAKEISIIGAKMPPGTLHRAVKILEAGIIDCDSIVTSVMALDKLSKAIEYFKNAKDKHIKIMIDPWL